jgi:hypothetical protein
MIGVPVSGSATRIAVPISPCCILDDLPNVSKEQTESSILLGLVALQNLQRSEPISANHCIVFRASSRVQTFPSERDLLKPLGA